MHRVYRAIAALGLVTLIVLSSVAIGNVALGAASGHTRITAAANVDWPLFGNTSDNTRFSTLTQINTGNVSKLGMAWTLSEGPNFTGFEDDPVVINGIMYVATGTNQVMAVNAATGHVLWKYTPKVNFYLSIHGGGGGAPTSRGVAVAKGVVYELTYDNQLIALQASTGEKLWVTTVADATQGYNETAPPTYWNGMLFVGSAVSDAGLRGYVAAYDAHTGKQLWRFFTVPARGRGWMPAVGEHGGGDVWMPPTIDSTTGILYFGTGNPSPDFVNTQRPGCDPWVDSTVALDARSGHMLWAKSQVCPDLWDYDSHQPPVLFTVYENGHAIRAVGQGNKDGHFWIFDAKTGKVLAVSPAVADESVPRAKPTQQGAKNCPGWLGGMEWSPPSYSPLTQAVYEQGINICMIFTTNPLSTVNDHKAGAADAGGYVAPYGKFSGTMSAINVNTGKFLWHVKMPKPMIGGDLATAGNLVFAGSDDGHLYAFNSRTGKILWKPNLGLSFGAAPMTYEINGTQYVAIAAGSGFGALDHGGSPGGTLAVFKLGGTAIKPLPIPKSIATPVVGLPSLKGMTQINPWMYVNAKTQTLVLKVVAGSSAAYSGFNFDGYGQGKANFIIPAGWGVTIEFSNKAALPHSLGISSSNKPGGQLPVLGFAPVLTPNAFAGVGPGITQVVGFGADQAGKYYMVCLVPGHIQAGMWDVLTVSKTATMPSIKVSGS